MAEYTKDWFTWNIPIWTEKLAKFKDGLDIKALEIGCYEGRATRWLLDNILTKNMSHIYCVDPFLKNEEYKNEFLNTYNCFYENLKDVWDKITLLKNYSQKIEFKKLPQMDIIYIDGSHKASDCIYDMVNSFEILKNGGIMIMDDYNWDLDLPEIEKPKLAIDSFLTIYERKYIILEKGYQMIIEKI